MLYETRNRALAILLISFIGCCFTGGVLVNAQAEEATTIEERLAYIEGTLEQMSDRLLELNHLSDRIDGIEDTLLARIDGIDDSLSARIDRLYNTIVVGSFALVIAILGQPLIEKKISK